MRRIICFHGDSNSGKSTLIGNHRNVGKSPTKPTLGLDVHPTEFANIWEFAGSFPIKNQNMDIVKLADLHVVMFDLHSIESYDYAMKKLLVLPLEKVILVGNKVDIMDQVVEPNVKGVKYLETSALSGRGVGELFKAMRV
jgi:GTPase SAR1 family protein